MIIKKLVHTVLPVAVPIKLFFNSLESRPGISRPLTAYPGWSGEAYNESFGSTSPITRTGTEPWKQIISVFTVSLKKSKNKPFFKNASYYKERKGVYIIDSSELFCFSSLGL